MKSQILSTVSFSSVDLVAMDITTVIWFLQDQGQFSECVSSRLSFLYSTQSNVRPCPFQSVQT